MSAAKASKASHLQEIVRCGRDPVHFLKNYVWIQHPVKGPLKFDTYPFQDECVREFEKNRFNVVLKSRQLGLSTVCAGYCLWLALFFKSKNILVIATKLGTAQNFVKKIKFALSKLPPWLVLPKYDVTQKEVRFSNGSSIVAIPTSEDAGRSEALSLLVVDEAAFIHNFEELWTGLYPTISRGGRAIVISTPNGVGNQFHKLFVDAAAKLNDFNPIKLPWRVHPEQDEAWFEKETRGMSQREISQEYECDFLSSGDTFLSPAEMTRLAASLAEPLEIDEAERNVWIWERPRAAERYVIAADVARGDAQDCSAFHVISCSDMSVVAEYKGHCKPDRLAELLVRIGRQYGDALLVLENNSFGYAATMKLSELDYPRVYYSNCRGDPWNYVPRYDDERAGFETNARTRTQILSKLEEAIRNKRLRLRSRRLHAEFTTFVWQGARAAAMRGTNDDLVMSLAIGCWIVDQHFSPIASKVGAQAQLARAMTVNRRPAPAIYVPRSTPYAAMGASGHEFAWLYR